MNKNLQENGKRQQKYQKKFNPHLTCSTPRRYRKKTSGKKIRP